MKESPIGRVPPRPSFACRWDCALSDPFLCLVGRIVHWQLVRSKFDIPPAYRKSRRERALALLGRVRASIHERAAAAFSHCPWPSRGSTRTPMLLPRAPPPGCLPASRWRFSRRPRPPSHEVRGRGLAPSKSNVLLSHSAHSTRGLLSFLPSFLAAASSLALASSPPARGSKPKPRRASSKRAGSLHRRSRPWLLPWGKSFGTWLLPGPAALPAPGPTLRIPPYTLNASVDGTAICSRPQAVVSPARQSRRQFP